MLGAYLVSHYANKTYADFVEERLFARLGMASSTYSPSVAHSSGLLTDTWTKSGRRIPFWARDETAELSAGPAGVISSAEDLVKWLAVLLNGGRDPATNETIVPRGVFEATTEAQRVMIGVGVEEFGSSIVGYGMGWMRSSIGTVEVRPSFLSRSEPMKAGGDGDARRSCITVGPFLAFRLWWRSRRTATLVLSC